jgi:hypothetical protein
VRIIQHPFRGTGLTVDLEAVEEFTDAFADEEPNFNPWAVLVLYNSDDGSPVANASPPNILMREYGIAKMTRGDLNNPYTSTHEIGHAGMNFLDEYIESGFENINIRSFDTLSFLTLGMGFGPGVSNMLGKYEIRLSEILSANGSENLDVTRYPARAHGNAQRSDGTDWQDYPGEEPFDDFQAEGGMFFGRGTYHQLGNNLMNSNRTVRLPGERIRLRSQRGSEPKSEPSL